MFIRTENLKDYIKLYPITTIIIGLNIFFFLLYHLHSIFPNLNVLFFEMIGNNFYIQNGDWWRLITPMFLHFETFHLLFNLVAIFIFAPPLEYMLGKLFFTIAYLGAGVLGDIGNYLFGPKSVIYNYLGASGAIFGLFGFFLYMVAIRRDLIDPQSRSVVLVVLIISLIFTFINPGIDILGHLCGLLGGFILAPLLLSFVKTRRS